jgi:H/ACA ribonucleoprotein complex non-core subunit NAF1
MESSPDHYELQEPDTERPAKRVRLEAPLGITTDTQNENMDEEDWDDVYGANGNPDSPVKHDTTLPSNVDATATATKENVAAQSANTAPSSVASHGQVKPAEELPEGVPAEAIAGDDELVAPPSQPSFVPQEEKVFQETTEIKRESPTMDEVKGAVSINGEDPSTGGAKITQAEQPIQELPQDPDSKDVQMIDTNGLLTRPGHAEDPEFIEAAMQQKDNKDAEWQYDSSDAESSDSDTSSDDDSSDASESGSEAGYEMLDPATAAKILMAGEGDDDEGGKSKGLNYQPRTANEVKEEVIPKPDVTITPETKTTFLGHVENVVENMVLIKGATPGEYQVLESGSVLCNENREVIGAVSDTFGRVQQPLYSVAFTNAAEIEQVGLKHGSQVFYVDDHSTFVFTQPLKNAKGTDASNIHDEEVAEDEQEFSDDEKEAQYKREKKLAKRSGRGGLSRSAFNDGSHSYRASEHDGRQPSKNISDAPSQSYGGGMSYDDEPVEEFYAPLKRPDNLGELMAGAPPPKPPQPFDRGRGGRGGGRGRGDRGRGDRGRGRGRGGFDQRERGGFRDNSRNFPNSQSGVPHNTPPSTSSYTSQNVPQAHFQNPHQQPTPQNYQFNGYSFQFGNQPMGQAPQHNPYYAQQQQQAQAPPPGPPPAGAYANTNYHQQAQQQQQPQAYNPWAGQQPYAQVYSGIPNQTTPPQQAQAPHAHVYPGPPNPIAQQPQAPTPDLNAILRNLGHHTAPQ